MKKIILMCVLIFGFFGISGTSALSLVACTQEAKLCPDGKTYVGRVGPNCDFQKCPNIATGANSVLCTEEEDPVCGKKFPDGDEIGGITYKTFSNKCYLENYGENHVFAYKGVCSNTGKSNIPGTCQKWYDGCNTCSRVGNTIVCTEKYCVQYEESRCLIKKPSSCPVFKLSVPPRGCDYKYVQNDDGCKTPKLVCNNSLSDEMKKRLDLLSSNFLGKLERKYGPQYDKRIFALKTVNLKLASLLKKKPRFENIISYLINGFQVEIERLSKDDLNDIIKILN